MELLVREVQNHIRALMLGMAKNAPVAQENMARNGIPSVVVFGTMWPVHPAELRARRNFEEMHISVNRQLHTRAGAALAGPSVWGPKHLAERIRLPGRGSL
ncbi:hypothetical protein [Variovorax sp. YR216]|uniref:hypothetical protein n=1 Tax=Variovorax sp. YR216 TaxID=1882828 RepID=UPI00089B2B56|nr:hypothetical protein [Variovorax sp. YR216]SEB09965.1 hypothetical protein SAMN05444680_107232 [Variovorax sp. YR216]